MRMTLLLWAVSGHAQQPQEQLAAQYYAQGSFAQAAELYETMYDRTPNKFYYQVIFRSYIELKRWNVAERLVERRLKQCPKELDLYVDLGRVQECKGESRRARKLFDKAVDKVGGDAKQLSDLCQAFENAKHPEYAVKAYLKAREKTGDEFVYVDEVAALYVKMEKYEAATQEYLGLLDEDAEAIQKVQVSLQQMLSEDAGHKIADGLRAALLKRVQAQPQNMSYVSMMIWYSLQQEDFLFAMEQAKAFDARFPLDKGKTLMLVADIAKHNQAYDVAQECFAAVAKKGAGNPYYYDSRMGLLDVQYERLASSLDVEEGRLRALLDDYAAVIAELGKGGRTANIMRRYAVLLAYHADSLQLAANVLYDILAIPRLSAKQRDETKLELGDLLLFAGDIWDASLLYMQVEKSNKDEVLGSMAKFKNAKLSYYNHDFLWAKTQLDVLRAATSKLIANDAMELALLISDNMEEDSTFVTLERYADAELLLYRNQLDSAWAVFESIVSGTLYHPLFDEVLLQKAKIKVRKRLFEDADTLLDQLVALYSDDILADDALLLQAQINEEHLNNIAKARECYEKIILNCPASLYVDRARKKYKELRDVNSQ